MTDAPEFPVRLSVEAEESHQRLDAFLAGRLTQFSRALLKRAIDAGHVLVDGQSHKASFKLAEGALVVVSQVDAPRPGPEPESIPLDLLHEDHDLVAVNKPAGMIVHPAKGHWAGTLASALAHHFGDTLSKTGGPTRPGIVHRLDRDTSGVIIVAKHDAAHHKLAEQFKDRSTEKQYLAIVIGVPDRDADVIDQPIGAHPKVREKMAIRAGHATSRDALTRFEVVERFERHALVRCFPKTGRTHQIRVHLAHAGHSVLCDKLYGGSAEVNKYELMRPIDAYQARKDDSPVLLEPILRRQALHAERLAINHPATGERLVIEAPLPDDMRHALDLLSGSG